MAAPYPPPSPGAPPLPVYRRRRRSVVWPVLLIVLGVVFLLQNAGVLSWQIWGSLWHLWPLILILVGLELFLGGFARGAITALGVALVALIIVGLAVAGSLTGWSYAGFGSAAGPVPSHTVTQALQGASSADVRIRFGAGSLNIAPLATPGDQLAEMSYTGPDRLTPSSSYQVRPNGVGQLLLGLSGHGQGLLSALSPGDQSANGQMVVQLNPKVPLALNVQEGAANSQVDLTKLQVTNLELQTGASTTTVLLPQAAGQTTARIEGGAATINVSIPQGVAAQISYKGGLSTLNVDESRFPSVGDRVYRSPDYATARNKVDLTIQAGVATVNVR